MKRKGLTTVNRFGIAIRQCCASCAFRELMEAVDTRHCNKHAKEVSAHYVCRCWRMNHNLRMAGLGNGKVKCKEYLRYLVTKRENEQKAQQLGLHILPKSILEIETSFEAEYGSIFEEI